MNIYHIKRQKKIPSDKIQILASEVHTENTKICVIFHLHILASLFIYLFIALLGKPVSWQDSAPLEYSNWNSKALTEKKSETRCAIMTADNGGTWHLIACETRYSRAVCKTKPSEYRNWIWGKDDRRMRAFLYQLHGKQSGFRKHSDVFALLTLLDCRTHFKSIKLHFSTRYSPQWQRFSKDLLEIRLDGRIKSFFQMHFFTFLYVDIYLDLSVPHISRLYTPLAVYQILTTIL